MNGAALALAVAILVVAAYAAKPDERRWFEPWSMSDRGELRLVIPAGIVAAAVAMLLIGVVAAAGGPAQ